MGLNYSKKISNVFDAVVENDINYVRNFLNTPDCDANLVDRNDNTALILSVLNKRWEIFSLLARHERVDLNARNNLGDTALLVAIRKKSVRYAIRLIKKGADVNLANGKTTPLHLAVEFSNDVTLELLLNGADPNVVDLLTITPLDAAVLANNLEIVSMLLCFGASTDVRSGILTSLMYAIMNKASRDVQMELLQFSSALETCGYASTVTVAIQYNSPILNEITQKFDVNFRDTYNSIDLAVRNQVDLASFELLWDKFNYETWICTFRKCVLFHILGSEVDDFSLKYGYVKIVAFSDKIGAVLDHHYCSTFRETDWIVSQVFQLILSNVDPSDVDSIQDFEGLICYLLTQGAWVSSLDLDLIYTADVTSSCFLRTLLHMNIVVNREDAPFSLVRLKYDVSEAPAKLFENGLLCDGEFRMKFVRETLRYFAAANVERDERFASELAVPSLLQLARDRFRSYVIERFNVKSYGMLESVLKYSSLPRFVCDTLTYDRPIY